MNTKFKSLPWHDAELRSISIDRSDAGNSDTVELVVKWPDGTKNCITFRDCYSFEAQMNFGIIAEETILEAVCLAESDKISEIKDKWGPLGVPLDNICSYRLNTNSTNGQIEICAMSYTLEEVVLGFCPAVFYVMKTFALLVLGFVASVLITKYWFHGFMFYEFPRPPDFLEPIWAADGDIFFNRVITEMFLVLEFLFTSSILYFRWRKF